MGISKFLVLETKEFIYYRQLLKENLRKKYGLPLNGEFLIESIKERLARGISQQTNHMSDFIHNCGFDNEHFIISVLIVRRSLNVTVERKIFVDPEF